MCCGLDCGDALKSQPGQRAGHIRTIRAELDRLLGTSFFLSEKLYDELLRMTGEREN